MRKLNPGYKLVTIPKGTYPKQDKDVQVIGYYTHIVASCKLPGARPSTRMTKAIADNTKTLATVDKDIGTLTPKVMAEDIGVPFHPRRREVLQGSRHRGEDALIRIMPARRAAPAIPESAATFWGMRPS